MPWKELELEWIYSWLGTIEVVYLYTWISASKSSGKVVISNFPPHVLNFF